MNVVNPNDNGTQIHTGSLSHLSYQLKQITVKHMEYFALSHRLEWNLKADLVSGCFQHELGN